MPKGIYTRTKPAANRKYEPGNEYDTPCGRLRIHAVFPKGHNGASNARAIVEFLGTGYTTNCQLSNIPAGKVKDRRLPTVYGVGYIDMEGTLPARGHAMRNVYDLWANMLKRCYHEHTGATVDARWHSFRCFLDTIHKVPGFAEWEQDTSMHLDKDIRVPGNLVYSVETCTFVSAAENVQDCLKRRWAKA